MNGMKAFFLKDLTSQSQWSDIFTTDGSKIMPRVIFTYDSGIHQSIANV